MSEPRYDHTQFGTVVVVGLGVVMGIVMAIYTALPPDTSRAGLYFTGGFLVAIVLLFGWLRVHITDDTLVVAFGVGVIKKRIPLAHINRAEAVRNKWWWGFGIRATSTGWMYNVSGLDAVQLHLDGDKMFRIGTDDADGLVRAIATTD